MALATVLVFLLTVDPVYAIIVASSSAWNTTNGADITVNFAGDYALEEGDTVVVFGGHGSKTGTYGPSTAGYILYDYSNMPLSDDSTGGLWIKTMGSTPDTSVTMQGGGDTAWGVAYVLYVLKGTLDATDGAFSDGGTKTSETSGVPNPASTDTAHNNSLVLAGCWGSTLDSSIGTISGYSNLQTAGGDDTNDIQVGMMTKVVTSRSTENPAAWSSWTASNYHCSTLDIVGAMVTTGATNVRRVVDVLTTTGTQSWTVPGDWNNYDNKIEVIGGGGGGDSAVGTGNGGGGGGAYAFIKNLSLTPGASVTYRVGTGGSADTNGGDTFFNRTSGSANTCSDTVSVCADRGDAGVNATGGSGGSVASGKPASCSGCYAGGSGGGGDTTGDTAGGGGGAGGPFGAGANGGAGTNDGRGGAGGPGGGGGASGGTTGEDAPITGGISGYGGDGPQGTGGPPENSSSSGADAIFGTGGGGTGPGETAAAGVSGRGASASSSREWWDTSSGFKAGPGGGGGGGSGGAGNGNTKGGPGGLYGGGGGGGESNGSAGGQGVIVVTYWVPSRPPLALTGKLKIYPGGKLKILQSFDDPT